MKKLFFVSIILGLFLVTVLSGCGGGKKASYKYYAYVANYNDNSISIYSLDPSNGALTTNLPVYQVSVRPDWLAAHPTRNFLYIFCNDNTVRTCRIDPATGALDQIDSETTPCSFHRAEIAPNGNYLYGANIIASSLYCYNIGSDGTLSEFDSGSPITLPNNPSCIKTDPTGNNLYAACGSGGFGLLSAYTIGTGGTLSLATTNSMISIDLPKSIAVNSSNQYIYVVSGGSGTVNCFKNGPALTDNGTSSSGGYSRSVICAGNFLYKVSHGQDYISCFGIESNGTLSDLGTVTAGDGPQSLAVDPNGNFLYVVNQYAETVWGYSIDHDTGGLSELSWTPKPNTGAAPEVIVTTKVR